MVLNPSSFWTQANALFRKSLTFQKRNVKTNVRLILFPLILCVLLALLQHFIDTQLNTPDFKCGCVCPNQRETCDDSEKLCGIQYSDETQATFCKIPNPPEWPPLLQLQYVYCKENQSCPFNMLFTAENRSFAQIVSDNMFPSALTVNSSDIMASLASNVLGSESSAGTDSFLDSGFTSALPVYYLQTQCPQNNSGFSFPYQIEGINFEQAILDVSTSHVDTDRTECVYMEICPYGCAILDYCCSDDINNELYQIYERNNSEGRINEIFSAVDFLNSNDDVFDVTVWYMPTSIWAENKLSRVPRSVNLISNAYLQFLRGPGTKMLFEFVKEMPKSETAYRLEIASLLGGLFFTWVILQLFPVSAEISEQQE
ncbi:ABC transporter A family member 7-like protein [Trifolium pratense]|uniref:ABC transporter A family member 7-like protein n=1 Tax=Trifolium pratense TaxID=57577 RepID=A0A2K3MUA5_TRIPR|nr:ABC transporter A family member 7-like protein [Trifolium pratense]